MKKSNSLCSDECAGKETCYNEKMDILFDIMNNENDVFLADGKGRAIRVSDSYETHYGVNAESIIGKSVYELEEEGVFKPSVTAAVIKERKKVTIMQKNRMGDNILTTGVPVFSDSGEMEYIISFNSIDIADMASLNDKYEKLKEMMDEYSPQIHYLKMKEFQERTYITKNKKMQEINELILQIATVDTNVLITGETGVGKSMVADMIHKVSNRAEGPFIEINCGAIPSQLIESELFGYEGGAFTGADSKGKAGKIELANGGTLFLDEVGELPLNLQIKLLHVTQQKKIMRVGSLKEINVDFRLISATNKNMEQAVRNGEFREDLYYRLNVINISVPALRERREDIIPLIMLFLKRFNLLYGKKTEMSSEVLSILQNYNWPGNIRQLENFIERMVVTAKEKIIMPEHLSEEVHFFRTGNADYTGRTLTEILETVEKEVFTDAFKKYRTSVDVGKALGISQSTAARKLRKYVPDYVIQRLSAYSQY